MQIRFNYIFSGTAKRLCFLFFESDGFLVQAVSFTHEQKIYYTGRGQTQNYCGVQLMVFVDPAMHISTFDQNSDVNEAIDDAGNSMVPTTKNNWYYSGQPQRALVYQCAAGLKYPANAGRKIADLKITISMSASDSMDKSHAIKMPVEFKDLPLP